MPVSQLFEVTIDAAGVSASKRVSKLSRKNRRHLRASGVMESSLPRLYKRELMIHVYTYVCIWAKTGEYLVFFLAFVDL